MLADPTLGSCADKGAQLNFSLPGGYPGQTKTAIIPGNPSNSLSLSTISTVITIEPPSLSTLQFIRSWVVYKLEESACLRRANLI